MNLKDKLKSSSLNRLQIDKDTVVFIKVLTLKELRTFKESDNDVALMAQLLFSSVVDENGKQVFDSIEEVDEIPIPTVEKIFEFAATVNKLDVEEVEEAKKN